MSVGVLGLKFLNFIITLLPDVDLSGIPVIENITDVMNIFAWINYFVPTSLLLALLTITGTYYVFKALYNVIRDFVL